tara:strand:+ start:818 stop:1798 length:981 start_codon:yes stop_codon:yes gene_type:complete
MIIKFYETNKIDLFQSKLLLLYGKNEGLKDETIGDLTKNKNEVTYYDEKEILENQNSFIESTLSKSLFENEKVIVIKRASDKIYKLIEEITSKNIEDLIIIISSVTLDKKSKLRAFFEKSRKYLCVAFYPDNEQTLAKLANNFFVKNKILISASNINLIVNRCNGSRENLINELKKIEYYSKNGKKISSEIIEKLTNLNENHNISELIDNCLAKNKKKINYILNENHFTNEDCILLTRTFLNKSKKILALSENYEISNNIEQTISTAKPPIFWKDKEITKKQVHEWSPENIKKLIYKINDLELNLKKNVKNSVHLMTDFILEQASA